MAESPREHEPLQSDPVVEGNETAAKREVLFAAVLNEVTRWQEIIKDPKVRQAATAAMRTLANIGISFADAVPFAGEVPSWLADLGKFTDRWAQVIGLSTDLTPDVSKEVAVGSEILEAYSGTAFPSHAFETTLQIKADWPRIVEGFKRLKELWSKEQADYRAHQPEIDGAIAEFVNEEAT